MTAAGDSCPGRVRRHVRSWRKTPCRNLSEQICAVFREFHEGPALVHHQPAALDREIPASLLFVRRALLAVQE